MEENLPDNIDQQFRDSLESFQQKPSKDIWENIETQLDKKERRVIVIWYRLAFSISACLIALFLFRGLLFHQTRKNADNYIANSPAASAKIAASKNIPPRAEDVGPSHLIRSGKILLTAKPIQSEQTKEQPLKAFKPAIFQLEQNHQFLEDHSIRLTTVHAMASPRWPRRWSLTAYYSKEFAGYSLADHDSTAANGKEIDKKERSVFSASAVVLVNYKIFGNWVIQSGLGYSWTNNIANPTTSYAVNNNGQIKFQVNTLSGYGYLSPPSLVTTRVGDSVITDRSYTRLQYLTVPFIASYKFKINKLTIMAGMGVTFNFLTRAILETKLEGPSYSQNESYVTMLGLKKINYGALLKTELQYPIYRGWSLDLVASFKNTLTPINLHTAVSTYPYNLGIGLGITHNF